MKKIDLIPVFGTSFAVYIPLIMIIVALLTFFDGFSRLIALIGIEWEDNTSSSSTSGSTMCCNTSSTAENENTMNPVLLEKIRTGKLIVGNELKQRQIAAQTSSNSSTTNITSNINNTRKSESVTSKMRIGMADITQMTHFTEALIPTPQPRYRHLDSNNSSSHNNSYDVDLEIPDPSASSSSPYNLHYSPYSTTSNTTGTNAGIVGSSTAEQIEIEKQRHSLFSYTGSRNKPTSTGATSGSSGGRNSSARNPINTTTGTTSTSRDLFSIDNDDDDVYTGRYSDV